MGPSGVRRMSEPSEVRRQARRLSLGGTSWWKEWSRDARDDIFRASPWPSRNLHPLHGEWCRNEACTGGGSCDWVPVSLASVLTTWPLLICPERYLRGAVLYVPLCRRELRQRMHTGPKTTQRVTGRTKTVGSVCSAPTPSCPSDPSSTIHCVHSTGKVQLSLPWKEGTRAVFVFCWLTDSLKRFCNHQLEIPWICVKFCPRRADKAQ